jgi:hypothetical protein
VSRVWRSEQAITLKRIVEDRAERRQSSHAARSGRVAEHRRQHFASYTMGYPEMMLVEVQDGCRFRSLLGVILAH